MYIGFIFSLRNWQLLGHWVCARVATLIGDIVPQSLFLQFCWWLDTFLNCNSLGNVFYWSSIIWMNYCQFITFSGMMTQSQWPASCWSLHMCTNNTKFFHTLKNYLAEQVNNDLLEIAKKRKGEKANERTLIIQTKNSWENKAIYFKYEVYKMEIPNVFSYLCILQLSICCRA